MKPSSKIVFFGNERLSSGFAPDGAPTFERLIKNGYHIVALVAHHTPGQSRTARGLEIETVAKHYNVPVLLPEKLNDITDDLARLQPDIGVLVAYGKMVPESIINLFPHGIINIHPSLLPKYRGPTPIEQALLDGAPETGVSLMGLVKAMDAGPIFAQAKIKLASTYTKQELTQRLLKLGGDLLMQQLPAILKGLAQPDTQDESEATYTQLLTKEVSKLDPSLAAEQLERQIRAYAVWPKSHITLFDKYEVIVKQARVANGPHDGALVIPCAHNTFLEISELTAPSGRTMSGADFARGYNKRA